MKKKYYSPASAAVVFRTEGLMAMSRNGGDEITGDEITGTDEFLSKGRGSADDGGSSIWKNMED